MCGRQKPEDPQNKPMADDAITQGGIGGLVSLVYICVIDRLKIFVCVSLIKFKICVCLGFQTVLPLKL